MTDKTSCSHREIDLRYTSVKHKESRANNTALKFPVIRTLSRRRSTCSRCHENERGHVGTRTATAIPRQPASGKNSSSYLTEELDIPGLTKIFDKNYSLFGKAFWVLAITGCFVAFSVLSIKRMIHYAAVPLGVRVEIVRESNVTFPAMTVCPFFPFIFSKKIDELRREYLMHFNSTNIQRNATVTFTIKNYYAPNHSIPYLELIRLPGLSATDLWNRTRVGEFRTFIECQYESGKNCHRTVLVKDVYTHFGVCVTLISDQEIIYDGAYNGITIDLHEHFNHRQVHWQHTVLLHDAEEDPKHILYKEGGQPIHPNRETTVTFLKTQFKRVNVRSHRCYPKKKVTQCISDCITKHVEENIDCTLPYISHSAHSECSTPESAARTFESTLKIHKNLDHLCSHCPPKCTENYYGPLFDSVYARTVTTAKLILLDNNLNVVEEFMSYPFDSLLADIGGNLGLFLGICTLTLCQLLEALGVKLKFAVTCCCTKRSGKGLFRKSNKNNK